MWMLVFTGSTAAVSIQRPQVFRVTGRVWACASDVNHCICWEPVVLHHWGADIWSFFTHWGVEENHHGPWQEQQNPLRVLLCFVCPPILSDHWVVFISATQGLLWLAGWMILWPEACWQTGAVKQLLLESMGTSAWEMECMSTLFWLGFLFFADTTQGKTLRILWSTSVGQSWMIGLFV